MTSTSATCTRNCGRGTLSGSVTRGCRNSKWTYNAVQECQPSLQLLDLTSAINQFRIKLLLASPERTGI